MSTDDRIVDLMQELLDSLARPVSNLPDKEIKHMIQNIDIDNRLDPDGNPSGGTVRGVGLSIDWQDGPLGAPDDPDRKEPNGAFVETVIVAAISRLDFYQTASRGRFACEENAVAIALLHDALSVLETRTKRRTSEGVEGTHAPEPYSPDDV